MFNVGENAPGYTGIAQTATAGETTPRNIASLLSRLPLRGYGPGFAGNVSFGNWLSGITVLPSGAMNCTHMPR